MRNSIEINNGELWHQNGKEGNSRRLQQEMNYQKLSEWTLLEPWKLSTGFQQQGTLLIKKKVALLTCPDSVPSTPARKWPWTQQSARGTGFPNTRNRWALQRIVTGYLLVPLICLLAPWRTGSNVLWPSSGLYRGGGNNQGPFVTNI